MLDQANKESVEIAMVLVGWLFIAGSACGIYELLRDKKRQFQRLNRKRGATKL